MVHLLKKAIIDSHKNGLIHLAKAELGRKKSIEFFHWRTKLQQTWMRRWTGKMISHITIQIYGLLVCNTKSLKKSVFFPPQFFYLKTSKLFYFGKQKLLQHPLEDFQLPVWNCSVLGKILVENLYLLHKSHFFQKAFEVLWFNNSLCIWLVVILPAPIHSHPPPPKKKAINLFLSVNELHPGWILEGAAVSTKGGAAI